jgi:hypothetical protein
VEGTQIGYIYSSSWRRAVNDGVAFTNAVNTLIDYYQVQGLIIDFRTNTGGQMDQANGGLSRLYNFNLSDFEIAERSDPDDHFAMRTVPSGFCSGNYWRFNANPYLYDKPIAVLTGPLTISAGDYNAMRLKFHPMVRFFGKPTNTAYTCFDMTFHNLNIPFPGWLAGYAAKNAYLPDDPDKYLIHNGFEVDEEIWLTPEDVAKGEDTVVKRALEWIQNLAYAHDVAVNNPYAIPGMDSVFVTAQVENPSQHELSVSADIKNKDNVLVDSLNLFDDGQHGDGIAGDNIWGTYYVPAEEQHYAVSVTTQDNNAETSRTLPNVVRFTTTGPLNMSDYQLGNLSGGISVPLRLSLRNNGSMSTAPAVKAYLSARDTNIIQINPNEQNFGDIPAGEFKESQGIYNLVLNSNVLADSIVSLSFKVSISSDGYVYWYDSSQVVLSIDKDTPNVPTTYSLSQNHPNPFNPSTKITFTLPKPEHVILAVYNTLGQKVATLLNTKMNVGSHDVQFNASTLPSGIYFYRIQAGEFSQVKKMVLLR